MPGGASVPGRVERWSLGMDGMCDFCVCLLCVGVGVMSAMEKVSLFSVDLFLVTRENFV